jgi:hypothetical protein
MGGDILKVVALLTMVVDHSAALLEGPQWLRMVGRVSLPVFALLVGYHCGRSSNRAAYLRRMLIWAVIAEIPFYLAFGRLGNVLFTFAGGIAVVMYCMSGWRGGVVVAVGLFVLDVMFGMPDYGWYAVVLVVNGALVVDDGPRELHCLVALMCVFFLNVFAGMGYVVGGIAGVVAFFGLVDYEGDRFLHDRRFFYAAYPAHLAALVLLRGLVL